MRGWNVRHTCILQSGIWGIRLWRQQMSASIQSSTIRKKTFCYHCLQSKHFRAAFWNPLQLGTEGVTPVNAFTYVWPWLYLSLCNQTIRSVRRNCYIWRVVQTRFPTSEITHKNCFCIYFWQQRTIAFLLVGLYYQQTWLLNREYRWPTADWVNAFLTNEVHAS
jgi:hypothetical protein